MRIRSICIVTLLAMLCACGGGSSSPSDNVDVQGTWEGTLTLSSAAGPENVVGVIANGGDAFLFDPKNGDVFVLPSISGEQVNGALTAYAPALGLLPDGTDHEAFTMSGQASHTSITGTFQGNGETGSFMISRHDPFNGTAKLTPGNYRGFTGGLQTDLDVSTDGRLLIDVVAIACSAETGTITQPSPNENLFKISIQNGCLGNGPGLGFESSTDFSGMLSGGPYYYIIVNSEKHPYFVEVE